MDTVIVASSQFYSHYPKRIPQGTVNAEAVLIRLDSEWDNLTVRIHWLNVASGVEKVVLLERDQPNTIPWEVLVDLSELRMGLDGMDGGTIVKPTVWLTYGYVVDGVDPESGSDPQPPTPSWEQQMVEQATAAANAAKEAKKTADNLQAAAEAGEFNGDPGPAGPPGKSPIIRNGTWWIWNNDTQDYTDTGVIASGGGGGGVTSYNDLSDRPKIGGVLLEGNKTAEQLGLATPSQIPNVPSWAMQPQKPAYTAQEVGAQPTGNYALRSEIPTKLPNPYSLTINGQVYDGSKAMSVEAVGGGAGGELLLAEYVHQGNQEIHFTSFDWETGIGECTEPHGLSDAVKVMVVPADYPASLPDDNAKYIPQEIALYQSSLYAVPIDGNRVKLTGDDKSTPISVDTGYASNSDIDMTKLRLEVPIGWSISNIPAGSPSLRVQITGFAMPVTPQYLQITSPEIGTRYFYFAQTPNFGINNPKQLVIFHTEITISATQSGIYASSGLTIFRGRRTDNATGLHDKGNIRRDSATGIPGGKQNVSITGLQSPSSFAYCSNGTEVRVYTLGRRAK